MNRWMVALLAIVILTVHWLLPLPAAAGPNAGGTLILHRNPTLTYTSGHSYCGESGLGFCEEAVVTGPASSDSIVVFHALAAFPAGSSPRLAGVTFGVEYDPDELDIVGSGSCGGVEIQHTNWPGSGTGTSLTWQTTQTGPLVELYWFAAHTQAGVDSTGLALVAHPQQGGLFADDAVPPAIDSIAAYGSLGFGAPGHDECPGLAPITTPAASRLTTIPSRTAPLCLGSSE